MRFSSLLKCAALFILLAMTAQLVFASQQTSSSKTESQPASTAALLVLNKVENTLAIIDPTSLTVLGRVPTGVGPHEVITSADGRLAYVANYGTQQVLGNSISIID